MGVFVLVGWLGLSGAVGWVASERGRSGPSWFGLALVASPVVALIFLVAVPARGKPLPRREEVEVPERVPEFRRDPRVVPDGPSQ